MHHAIEAALELQQFLDEHGEKFCIIGGLAVQRWGEVRLTVDADATVKWIVFPSSSLEMISLALAKTSRSGVGFFPALENIQSLGLKEFNNRIDDVDEVDAAGFGFGIHSFVARHPPRFGLRHGFCR